MEAGEFRKKQRGKNLLLLFLLTFLAVLLFFVATIKTKF